MGASFQPWMPLARPMHRAGMIVARRERLRTKFGAFSVHDDIRELRENGPR